MRYNLVFLAQLFDCDAILYIALYAIEILDFIQYFDQSVYWRPIFEKGITTEAFVFESVQHSVDPFGGWGEIPFVGLVVYEDFGFGEWIALV